MPWPRQSGGAKPIAWSTPSRRPKRRWSLVACGAKVLVVRDVELDDLTDVAQPSRGASREGPAAPEARDRDVGALLDRPLAVVNASESEVRRCPRDQESLAVEECHGATLLRTLVGVCGKVGAVRRRLGGTGPADEASPCERRAPVTTSTSARATRRVRQGWPRSSAVRARCRSTGSRTRWPSSRRAAVVVATPWDAVVATVLPLASSLEGTVVTSMVNALAEAGPLEMVALLPARGSMAAELQAALPGSSVTAAMHHLPASLMEDLDSGLVADVLVCGDSTPPHAGRRGLHRHDGGPACRRSREPRPGRPDRVLHRGLHHGNFGTRSTRRWARGAVTVRLYDTASARSSPFEPGPGSRCTPAASRPTTPRTSATRRPTSPTTCCNGGFATSARDALRPQRHRRRRRHPAQGARARRALPRPRGGGDRALRRDMAGLGLLPRLREPRATSAIADILRCIGRSLDSGHAYQAGGAVYFDVVRRPGLRLDLPPRPRARCWRSPTERGGNPDDPNKETRSTSCSGSPPSPTSPSWESCGGRDDPVAHRVLRARAPRARSDDRPARRRRDLDLPPPRVRERRSRSRSTGTSRFVRYWMHVGMVRPRRREDVEVARQPRLRRRPAEGAPAARGPPGPARHHYRLTGTWTDETARRSGRAAPVRLRGAGAATVTAALDERASRVGRRPRHARRACGGRRGAESARTCRRRWRSSAFRC